MKLSAKTSSGSPAVLSGLALITMLVLSVGVGSVLAQGGSPPADATPGASVDGCCGPDCCS